MKLSDRLFEQGVFAQGIGFPTVPRDKARVRTIVTATHTREELQFALDVFAAVGRELGIIDEASTGRRQRRSASDSFTQLVLFAVCLLPSAFQGGPSLAQTRRRPTASAPLLQRLERIVQSGDRPGLPGCCRKRRTGTPPASSRDSSSTPGATRVVVRERDREPLDRDAAGQRLPADARCLHRVREPRPQRDVAARCEAGRRRQRRGLADRRPAAVRAGRKPPPSFARSDQAVRRARSHARARRSRARLGRASAFVVDTDRRHHRTGAARPRRDPVPPDAGHREGTAEDLLRVGDAPDAVSMRRSSRVNADDVETLIAADRLIPRRRRSARAAAGGAAVPRGGPEIATPST